METNTPATPPDKDTPTTSTTQDSGAPDTGATDTTTTENPDFVDATPGLGGVGAGDPGGLDPQAPIVNDAEQTNTSS